MIDTIRFRGPSTAARFDFKMEKYYVFRNSDSELEYIPLTLIENKKDEKKRSIYRLFFSPSTDTLEVELSLPKALFGSNSFNYTNSVLDLNQIIRHVGDFFFSRNNYYVTRVDLGHVFYSESDAAKKRLIDSFRHSRLPGAYARSFKHQNYADSVFYKTKNWSIKVYDKYAETVHLYGEDEAKKMLPNPNIVRMEKTYRMNEFKRLGLHVEAYKGCFIDEFDISILFDDYFTTFENWDKTTKVYNTDKKGALGLLNIIDNAGLLSEIENSGVVHRQTIYRYRKAKRADVVDDFSIPYIQNISPEDLRKWKYYLTFGVSTALS